MKKLFALLLAAAMIISLAACGGSDTKDTTASGTTKATEATKATEGTKATEATKATEPASDPKDWPVVHVETLKSIDDVFLLDEVQDAMNARLVELNAGAQVELVCYSMGDRSTVLTLMLSDPSDPIDLFGWRFYSTPLKLKQNGQAICLDKYREVYPDLWELFPEETYWTCEVDGEAYCLPGADSFGNMGVYSIRTDLLEKAGLADKYKEGDVIGIEELDEIVMAGEAVDPAMAWCGSMWNFCLLNIDYLANGKAVGVLLDRGYKQTEIVNYYATDEWADYCKVMKKWADNGIFVNDPLNNRQGGAGSVNNNIIAGYTYEAYSIPYAASLMSAQIYDYPMTTFQISKHGADSACVYNGWSISTVCANPDAAMAVLYYLYTDTELARYQAMGIEGKSYVVDENNCAWYPEGISATESGWTCSCPWYYPNECLCLPFETSYSTYYTGMVEYWTDPKIEKSAAFGFTFNNANVYDNYAACEAAVDEYRSALLYGQVDVDEYLGKFNAELESNGMADILTEMNKQFAEFRNKH